MPLIKGHAHFDSVGAILNDFEKHYRVPADLHTHNFEEHLELLLKNDMYAMYYPEKYKRLEFYLQELKRLKWGITSKEVWEIIHAKIHTDGNKEQ